MRPRASVSSWNARTKPRNWTSDLPPRLERHLLHAPVGHLADQQLVLVAAVDGIGEPELFRQFPGGAELSDDFAIELNLVDRRVFHAVRVAGVRDVEILRGSLRHADGQRRADVAELRLE